MYRSTSKYKDTMDEYQLEGMEWQENHPMKFEIVFVRTNN